MPFYLDIEKRKEMVRNYIRHHPRATFREINKILHTKLDRVYSGGINEAYEDAGISKPRTLKFKTKEERKKILREYIRRNPTAGGHTIRNITKIDFLTLFNNTEEMFEYAGVSYPRKEFRSLRGREKEDKKKKIIELVRNNPLISIEEIGKRVKTNPYSLFKNIKEIYQLAKVPYIVGTNKRAENKRTKVIEYIKSNNFATQREINNSCHTHVQIIFNKGIFEAYEKSGVKYPYERLKLHGTILKEIRNDALRFEEEIAKKLSGYGVVNRLVKTKRGFADIILERKGEKFVFELKNYKCHEISLSQIKQLSKYMEDLGVKVGFLICLKKPKKDMFLIGENKIFVLLESELSRIPEITAL